MKKPVKSAFCVQLLCGQAERAAAQAEILRAAGLACDAGPFNADAWRRLRQDPPAALILDLDRAPAQSRDIGLAVRKNAATRQVALVFAGGDASQVAVVRNLLPDAVFAPWSRLAAGVKRALASPPAKPVVPGSVFDGYSGTPLPRKLGIRAGSKVVLVQAPRDFRRTLGRLPEGVKWASAGDSCDLLLWFVRSKAELDKGLPKIKPQIGTGGLWIAWQKQASGQATDLKEAVVRQTGLAAGLVDYKICSIDHRWSALRFALRKAAGGKKA